MDSLIVDIELDQMVNRKKPDTIKVGHIYLICALECLHRVRIDHNDMEKKRCLCFYIDNGDEEWFLMDEIYECKPEFVKFPAQAICLSLFGLEDFAENPNAKQHLDAVLLSKTLIGDVASTQDEFEQQDSSDYIAAKVQIALYDTSSEEDVNLNPIILDKICADCIEPTFQPNSLTNVFISHVATNGDVYCQLRGTSGGVHYVQKLIHHLTQFKFNRQQHQLIVDVQSKKLESKKDQLYLIQDTEDKKWYRATILDNSAVDTFNMFYVDFGMARIVQTSNIFCLDSLSVALFKYPYQAIMCQLHEIYEFTPSIVNSIKGYLNPNKQAIVSVELFCSFQFLI